MSTRELNKDEVNNYEMNENSSMKRLREADAAFKQAQDAIVNHMMNEIGADKAGAAGDQAGGHATEVPRSGGAESEATAPRPRRSTDAVGRSVLALLIVMSIASWYFIITKGVRATARRMRSNRFLRFFWDESDSSFIGFLSRGLQGHLDAALEQEPGDDVFFQFPLRRIGTLAL